jgi:hypothetical protein
MDSSCQKKTLLSGPVAGYSRWMATKLEIHGKMNNRGFLLLVTAYHPHDGLKQPKSPNSNMASTTISY